jgi:hypothetical protein
VLTAESNTVRVLTPCYRLPYTSCRRGPVRAQTKTRNLRIGPGLNRRVRWTRPASHLTCSRRSAMVHLWTAARLRICGPEPRAAGHATLRVPSRSAASTTEPSALRRHGSEMHYGGPAPACLRSPSSCNSLQVRGVASGRAAPPCPSTARPGHGRRRPSTYLFVKEPGQGEASTPIYEVYDRSLTIFERHLLDGWSSGRTSLIPWFRRRGVRAGTP